MDVLKRAESTITKHGLANFDTPVLLMVSGGSDSTALAYLSSDLVEQGVIGPCALLHVNHRLRGEAADEDARFVGELAALLDLPFFCCEVDVAALVEEEGANLEAVARRERYAAAHEALTSLCRHAGAPLSSGRIFTAHTADDRVENFYMRSIVGTGPGGFRAMRYLNGQVARPVLEVGRDDLRAYLAERAQSGAPVQRDGEGELWREDATNAHTDRFRAFVRHNIVPQAKERNPQLLETLTRTMNLIADEDDMLEERASEVVERCVSWIEPDEARVGDFGSGCVLSPPFAREPHPLKRRVVVRVLACLLGDEARVETVAVDAVLASYRDSEVNSGYATNIQGDLAVSANKRGVRIEPMAAFRARRKRDGARTGERT